ncbi:HdeD family acid-resistance protein [Streptomyces sp. RKAG337]|uniref:HdeD family acid-resistance protein n=1 Tax=Streptomyces sp. RKAG337 TaxID=2893404 RepID=UPI00203411F6|nr:HdeD family acid-resistance protein [Streptomyces sp. RKAG337]MCM2425258.1 HdeD family acid-resistance protein [Streptomyces sp. RKAG337]
MAALRKRDPRPEARISRSFGWLTALGAVLVLCGLFGLAYTAFATLTSVLLFGWLLLIGGFVGLLHAVQSRDTNFFWLALVVAALNLAAGVVVIRRPDGTAAALTMFAALLFLAGGVFRLFGGLVVRGPQTVSTVLQGAVGILLGVLVLANWPESSRYVLGFFFSLMLLFDGLGLMAGGIGGRRVVGMVTDARAEAAAQGEARGEGVVGPGPEAAAPAGPPNDPMVEHSTKQEQGDRNQSPG